MSKSPQTVEELLERAQTLAGKTLGMIAAQAKIKLPENLLHNKGIVGQVLESELGASAGNKSAPDFEKLGIELKTIPVTKKGKPKETTYICVAPLISNAGLLWRESSVYKKLAKVLWVPIESEKDIPLSERRVGTALLWDMPFDYESILQQDWEDHMEKISSGLVGEITAHQGIYLQIRPKAANSKVRTQAVGPNGNIIETLPRGFYLRTEFTEKILRKGYHSI